MARRRIMIPVTDIKGIGKKTAKKLAKNRIKTAKGILRLKPETLADKIGVSVETAKKYQDRANKERKLAKKKRKKKIKEKKRKRRAKRIGKKIIFIVVDGLADMLENDKTPLEKAKKPAIDWFVKNGECGQLHLLDEDSAVASHLANVSLLGYDYSRYYLKRGPLEAVGSKIPYTNGEVAMRCNFATVDRDHIIVDRRAGRDFYRLDELTRYINTRVDIGAKYIFMRTYGHRAVFVIKERLSDQITGNDNEVGEHTDDIKALSKAAKRTAELVDKFVKNTRNVIQYHSINSDRIDKGLEPANSVLVREAGNRIPKIGSFVRKWKLKRAVCISENGVMKGTCSIAGFHTVNVPEFNGKYDDIDFIFDSVKSTLKKNDFVYAHIKGADEAAHDMDPVRKKRVIEKIDKRMDEFKDFDGILVLTCDHITSSYTGRHEHGDVPVLVYGKSRDSVKKFDEKSVKDGSLGVMSGKQLIKHIIYK